MRNRNLTSMAAAGFIGVLLVAAAAQPAYSRPDRDVVVEAPFEKGALTERVNFTISDIRSLTGQKELVRRVRQATYRVCTDDNSADERIQCRDGAWAGAKPQIDRAIDRAMSMADAGAPISMTIAIIAAK